MQSSRTHHGDFDTCCLCRHHILCLGGLILTSCIANKTHQTNMGSATASQSRTQGSYKPRPTKTWSNSGSSTWPWGHHNPDDHHDVDRVLAQATKEAVTAQTDQPQHQDGAATRTHQHQRYQRRTTGLPTTLVSTIHAADHPQPGHASDSDGDATAAPQSRYRERSITLYETAHSLDIAGRRTTSRTTGEATITNTSRGQTAGPRSSQIIYDTAI